MLPAAPFLIGLFLYDTVSPSTRVRTGAGDAESCKRNQGLGNHHCCRGGLLPCWDFAFLGHISIALLVQYIIFRERTGAFRGCC